MYFVASMFVLEFPDVLGEFSAVFAFSRLQQQDKALQLMPDGKTSHH